MAGPTSVEDYLAALPRPHGSWHTSVVYSTDMSPRSRCTALPLGLCHCSWRKIA